MQIYLNGELTDTPSQNLLQLIQELALEGKRFAVEHNQQITIAQHDRIEIIHAVGGG